MGVASSLIGRDPTARRRLLQALLLGVAGLPARGAIASKAWPSRTVRIIVPFAPGGGADVSARVLAELLTPELGQSVIVENRPGAGSAIGVTAAANSSDGHTLLMGSNSMVINPSLNPAITYEVARDFDAIGMVSSQPLVLVVPAQSAIRSLDDLIAEARRRPGELTAGNSGNGTLAHLTAELFSLETGTTLTHVPYKGESALMPDLLAGRVALGFLNLPSVIAHIRGGRLHPIAVSSASPVEELPSVPTFRSLNRPSLEVRGWAALLAPKGTIPATELDRLATLLAKALASETVKTRFAALSVRPEIMDRSATDRHLADEGARWKKVIETRGIKAGS
ncbi:MAG: tripartite tricarboxylate transporter substrate binding protein [Burkholderiaceae bacterium]|nr:tripartite tricarboxylate transporter substrate binding protein [Burkholderiaceae bacterium]